MMLMSPSPFASTATATCSTAGRFVPKRHEEPCLFNRSPRQTFDCPYNTEWNELDDRAHHRWAGGRSSMEQAALSPLAAWESFYVIIGSAAAALTGLQFVVMTLSAGMNARGSDTVMSAFST